MQETSLQRDSVFRRRAYVLILCFSSIKHLTLIAKSVFSAKAEIDLIFFNSF